MNEVNAENILASIIIPPRPTILLQIQKAREQDASLAEIAELIAQDISLSAVVLKTINSAYYGLSDKVTSLKQAVSLLGLENITMLITGLSLRNIPTTLNNIDAFWNHSSQIAAISAFITQYMGGVKGINGINKEEAQLFGLFQNCGKILLSQKFDDYDDTLRMATGFAQTLIDLERQRHRTDHGLAGGLLSAAWCLPTRITVAIRYHHDITVFRDGAVSDQVLTLIAINHLSEYLVNQNSPAIDDEYTENGWLSNTEELMNFLKITENDLEDLQVQVNELLNHLSDLK